VSNVRDWEYSSFNKFVKQRWYEINWGSLENLKNINNIGNFIYDNVIQAMA